MGVKKLAAKVADYKQRLEDGKASKIEPDHVEKVLAKLRRKQADLDQRLEETTGTDERERLEVALATSDYLEATAKILHKHNGLWFNDEAFVVSRREKAG